MGSGFTQAVVLALLTGWLGYVLAGRRWRQEERRAVYREYLHAAHETLDVLYEFERRWEQNPDEMPTELYEKLMEKNRKLESASHDVHLIAPMKVYNAAHI